MVCALQFPEQYQNSWEDCMEVKSSDKPLALITGASSGVGYELAKQFAQNGYDLVLVSENPAIVEAAQACRSLGAEVESHVVDLAESNGADELIGIVNDTGRTLEAIAINNGIGAEVDDEAAIVNLNIVSSVLLTRHFMKDMVKKKNGKILFTSSIEGKMPGPLAAVYRASKAFIQTFSEVIRNEVQGTGVTVTELVPYATETHFSQPAGEIAELGFKYMVAGEGHVEVDLKKFKSEQGKSNTARPFGDPSKLKH